MLFPHFSHPQEGNEKEAVDKVMTDLDRDGDAKLNFQEFIGIVVCLTLAIHEAFGGSFPSTQFKC